MRNDRGSLRGSRRVRDGLCEVQTALMKANNDMNERVKTFEEMGDWKAWNVMAEQTCSLEPTFITPVSITSMQEYTCSECGEFAYQYVVSDGDALKFCPNCGRKAVYDD